MRHIPLVVICFAMLSGSVYANARVEEKPQAGEKSRVTHLNSEGKKELVEIVYTDGRWRKETYSPVTGELKGARQQISEDWTVTTAPSILYKDKVTEETIWNGREKYRTAYSQKDGTLLITWFDNSKNDEPTSCAIVEPDGSYKRFNIGTRTIIGLVVQGKREKLADGSEIMTEFSSEDGKTPSRSVQCFENGKMKITVFENGKKKQASLYSSYNEDSVYNRLLSAEYFKNGVLYCHEDVTAEENNPDPDAIVRVLTVYAADGKTVSYKQHYRRYLNSSYIQLSHVEEYNADGSTSRILVRDKNQLIGLVSEIRYFEKGKLTKIVSMRNNDSDSIDGTVEKIEYFNKDGKTKKVEFFSADEKVSETFDAKSITADPRK